MFTTCANYNELLLFFVSRGYGSPGSHHVEARFSNFDRRLSLSETTGENYLGYGEGMIVNRILFPFVLSIGMLLTYS